MLKKTISITQKIIHPKQRHKPLINNSWQTQKTKWPTFTYYCSDTRTITKLLKNTNMRIAFKTTNTIRKHLKPREGAIYTCNQSGAYQLKCNEYPFKYIEQTGRIFENISKP
jgi:hypothetical protein